MITELPKDARQCSLSGVFITPDARVFKAGKNGFREVTVKADKKGPGKFYNSAEKKYYSLTQAYAEAFVPNGEQKPLAFIKDASHGLDPANIMWATNDEWREYWKEHAERKCKCCGKLVEKDMAGELCKGCFTKMSNAKPDTDEIKRFQERVAATGFDPNKDFFSGRQRDALELFCSGVSMPKIASILGCDLKTANACIKSAKVARTLERATSDNVTPIGYKSTADVLPASITLSADGSKPIASKDFKVTRDAKITNQSSKSEPLSNVYVHLEKPKVAEPEETTPDWYDQERLLARENIPVQKSHDTDSHTIIGKLAKLLKCSLKTAILIISEFRDAQDGPSYWEQADLQKYVRTSWDKSASAAAAISAVLFIASIFVFLLKLPGLGIIFAVFGILQARHLALIYKTGLATVFTWLNCASLIFGVIQLIGTLSPNIIEFLQKMLLIQR